MKKIGLLIALAAVMLLATDADAIKNDQGKWALHYAGAHDAKGNTCVFEVTVCEDIEVDGGPGGDGENTRYDVYIVATNVVGIAGTRFGLACDGTFFFYGWTKCSTFETPGSGWPGCGAGEVLTWGGQAGEQPGPFVTLGILDVYVYGATNSMSTTTDPRVGHAEWCDQSEPSPICVSITDPAHFGTVGFNGTQGTNPCGVPVEVASWGKIKAMFR